MVTKSTNDFKSLDFTAGEVILIDKPPYWSSYKVVHKVKKAIRAKKVGHAGTLDPVATGLLILCTGKKTKEIYKYQDLRIDVDEIKQDIMASFNAAIALAVNASYATKESIEHLLRKAFGNARALSINSGYATSETAKEILYSAESKALALYEKAKKSGYS